MKSRTNAQQELMRQQIIEEERHSQYPSVRGVKTLSPSLKMPCKPFVALAKPPSTDPLINKRQRSSSYSVTSYNYQTKPGFLSPATKSPMDLAFSNLGNDDVLDWSLIEPSITSTSEISQDLIDQMTRGTHDSFMETGTEENDSIKDDDNSVHSMKPSTSCPANMANPSLHSGQGHSLLLVSAQQQHKAAQKPGNNAGMVASGLVEDHKLQWMRDRNKKDCHNRIERKRRDYINNQIQELGQLLPEKLFLSTESKRNKGGILKNSVIYIQQLQQVLTCFHHLQKEAQLSENVITHFYKRIQSLEELLTLNGINVDQTGNEKVTLQQWFNVHQQNSKHLQTVNSIQSSWSSEHDHNDQSSSSTYITGYEEVTVKTEDVSAENVLNSGPIGRVHSSNSGAGGSSSGTQSVTNYNSPLTATSITSSINNNNNNNNNSSGSNIIRSRTSQPSNVIVSTNNSPQQRHSQIYGSSQPFSKTGIRLCDQSSKSCISTDSPVLSSILSGHAANLPATTSSSGTGRAQIFTGHSNSVPDGTRAAYFTQSSNTDNSTSGERYYLIPISKATKGIQFLSNDYSSSRAGIIKIDTNLSNPDDPVLSRIHSDTSHRNPHITMLNSYQLSHDDGEVQNFIEISPNQNDNDDSLMGEFEFDDIPME